MLFLCNKLIFVFERDLKIFTLVVNFNEISTKGECYIDNIFNNLTNFVCGNFALTL